MRSLLSVGLSATVTVGLVVAGAGAASAAPENHRPGRVQLSTSSVAEDAGVGTVVGLLSASDRDPNYHHRFVLTAGKGSDDNGLFTIRRNALVLTGALDYESQSRITVRVRVRDGRGAARATPISFGVTDRPEAPTGLSLSGSSVPENQPVGSSVGSLAAVDADAGDMLTYQVVSGAFRVVGDQLQTASVFDHEVSTTQEVRVRATDSTGLSMERTFSVSVTDVDEPTPPVVPPVISWPVNHAPYGLTPTAASVAENEPAGTIVATAAATDPDGDALTYSLVGGGGVCKRPSAILRGCRTPLVAFTVTPDGTIRTTHELNYEGTASYPVTVKASDPAGLTTESTITIAVTDVNDAPWNIALTGDAITANSDWALAGTLSAQDEDAGDVATFAILDVVDTQGAPVDSGLFEISGCGTWRLYADTNTLAVGSYQVTIRATDNASATLDQSVTVTVSAQEVQSPPRARAAMRRC